MDKKGIVTVILDIDGEKEELFSIGNAISSNTSEDISGKKRWIEETISMVRYQFITAMCKRFFGWSLFSLDKYLKDKTIEELK